MVWYDSELSLVLVEALPGLAVVAQRRLARIAPAGIGVREILHLGLDGDLGLETGQARVFGEQGIFFGGRRCGARGRRVAPRVGHKAGAGPNILAHLVALPAGRTEAEDGTVDHGLDVANVGVAGTVGVGCRVGVDRTDHETVGIGRRSQGGQGGDGGDGEGKELHGCLVDRLFCWRVGLQRECAERLDDGPEIEIVRLN